MVYSGSVPIEERSAKQQAKARYWQKHKKRLAAINREWQKANPEKMRQYKLKHRFKLSVEDVEKLGKVCHICKQQKDKMCVDHDHSSGEVRGLLCHGCNVAIGFFEEDIGRIQQAILYLSK